METLVHNQIIPMKATVMAISPVRVGSSGKGYRHVTLEKADKTYIDVICAEKIFTRTSVQLSDDNKEVESRSHTFEEGDYVFMKLRYSEEGKPMLDGDKPVLGADKKPRMHKNSGFSTLQVAKHKAPSNGTFTLADLAGAMASLHK